MNMRSSTDPYGGLNPLVDRIIGPKAYDIVKFVAERMGFVQYVAGNMEAIVNVNNNLMSTYQAMGITPVAGQSVSLQMPFPILPVVVLSTQVAVRTLNGGFYTAESGYFRWSIQGNTLQFTLNANAPAALENAQLIWTLTGS